jgi:hypothetical protein
VARRLPKIISRSGVALAAVSALFFSPSALAAAAAPSPSTLYREALATTTGWRVHYVSQSTTSHVPFMESGDAGPASGTQSILIGKGATLDTATLIVIGDLTFVKGNTLAMEDLIGLSPAAAAIAVGHWVLFSSNNPTFASVVVGVRSHDVAQEVALTGPYSLGPSRRLDGHTVDALRGTLETQGTKKTKAVLYVRASGRHLLVQEDALGAHGKPNGTEHIVFSKWGEAVRPAAPAASLTLGSISAT